MNKKLLAVAVASALAAPVAAFAQTSVTIYGRANLGIDSWRATGSSIDPVLDYKSRTRVYDSGSRIGFMGTEELGGGMQAYFRFESGVNVDTGNGNGQSGAANVSSGFLASRDSFVGIKGGWGEVSWGRQSIFWANGLNAQTGANYINSAVDGMLNGTGLVAIPVSRQSNVMAYTTPRLGGMWDATLSYSPTREAAGQLASVTASGTPTSNTSDNIYGLTVKFRTGPWYAQFDHARTKLAAADFATPGRKNSANKLGVSYGYAPDSRVGVIWERNKNNQVAGDAIVSLEGDNLRQTVWLFNIEHAIGSWRLYGQYAKAGNVAGATGLGVSTGSTGYTLAVKNMLSPRTGIYVSYSAINNKEGAFADLNGGGYSSALGGALSGLNPTTTPTTTGNAAYGTDLRIWAVGMMHNF